MHQLESNHLLQFNIYSVLSSPINPRGVFRPSGDQGFPEAVGKGFAVSRSGETRVALVKTNNNGEVGVDNFNSHVCCS